MKKTQAEYWAPKIHAEWRKSVEGILGVGRQLIAAKEACEHGEFLRLFKGRENAVSEPLPFGDKTAQRLMSIAANDVIANGAHAHHLPCEWTTLYELTKLDDETLIAGIKAGEITPETTRAQAREMHADPVDNPGKPPHEEMASAVKNAVTKFVGQLTTHEQYMYVRRRIEQLLEFLAEMEAENGVGRSGKTTARTRAG
jgi:hypothetical protein